MSGSRLMMVLGMMGCLALGAVGGCAKGGCAGCDGKSCNESHCKSFKGTPTTVNKMCVVRTEDPVDPAVKPVVWKGTEYGLCCEGCRPKWNAMTDGQKDTAVAKVATAAH